MRTDRILRNTQPSTAWPSLDAPEVHAKANLDGIKCSQTLSDLLLAVYGVEHWKSGRFSLTFGSNLLSTLFSVVKSV